MVARTVHAYFDLMCQNGVAGHDRANAVHLVAHVNVRDADHASMLPDDRRGIGRHGYVPGVFIVHAELRAGRRRHRAARGGDGATVPGAVVGSLHDDFDGGVDPILGHGPDVNLIAYLQGGGSNRLVSFADDGVVGQRHNDHGAVRVMHGDRGRRCRCDRSFDLEQVYLLLHHDLESCGGAVLDLCLDVDVNAHFEIGCGDLLVAFVDDRARRQGQDDVGAVGVVHGDRGRGGCGDAAFDLHHRFGRSTRVPVSPAAVCADGYGDHDRNQNEHHDECEWDLLHLSSK